MASKIQELAWAAKANEIRERLPDPDAMRQALGTLIVERLLTFGPFFQSLADQMERETSARGRLQDEAVSPTPPKQATCRIGGLLLTAGLAGAAGNALRATVTPGIASTFRPVTVDIPASQRQLGFALDALDGAVPFLSQDDPELAALQQQTAAFLASLDEATRSEAKSMVENRWNDARAASPTLTPERIRQDMQVAVESLGITPEQEAAAMQTFDDVEQQKAAGAASIFSLNVRNILTTASESFTEIVSGYPFALRGSVLVSSFEWLSNDRPPDGIYAFSGGSDGTSQASSAPAPRAPSEYVFRLDARRSYTLPELEKIVVDAMAAADQWLH